MGELKKLQWAAWKEKKNTCYHAQNSTHRRTWFLWSRLPASASASWELSAWSKGLKKACKDHNERERKTVFVCKNWNWRRYVKTAVFTYLLQFQFHRFKETAWLSSPGEELFNGTWRLKHQLSWILYTQLTLTQYWISRNSKTFKTYSFVFELSSDIDIIINKELCVT